MSSRKVKKYIESHWLVFALQGIVGLLFGWFVMFTNIQEVSTLVVISGSTLLALGVIDVANLIYRKRRQQNWGLALMLMFLNLAVGLALLFTKDLNVAWALGLLAGYTIFCGVFEILQGFKSLSDPTDRFMWIVCGICACILGFVVLNSGHFENPTTFIKFFGTYMMIYGITTLIYAVHNKNELAEQKEERRLAREKRKAEKAAAERSRNPLSKLFKGKKSTKK
ncbi:DUF308 domain-containing protein [Candidatus Saccharibacteria bacterium]|nr:DUF308 domain-containing protein [Candidatus Saccharibacteria bacterium]